MIAVFFHVIELACFYPITVYSPHLALVEAVESRS